MTLEIFFGTEENLWRSHPVEVHLTKSHCSRFGCVDKYPGSVSRRYRLASCKFVLSVCMAITSLSLKFPNARRLCRETLLQRWFPLRRLVLPLG
ncbi:MAG: hypothetical protein ACREPR_17265 [Brasilonema sp.]